MRAKVDDFAYVLVAAIVIIAVVLVIFASIPPGGIGIITSIENFTLGPVGFTGDNMVSQSYGSFRVGDVNTETLRKLPQVQVSSSYFGGKSEKMQVNVLNAYVPLAREAVITFYAHDSTPAYGKLIIKWNGLELYNDGASKGGPYNLHISRQYIKEMNNLEISCDGPGLYFWASTVYVLRDFKVNLDYGSMKLIPFTLSSEDLETFKNGALEFSAPGAEGRLTVKVNGAQVFSKVPDSSESVKFDLFNSGVNPGNNLITLSVQGDPVQMNSVALKIFLSTDSVVSERMIAIPKEKMDLFLQGYRGKIEFDVKKTIKYGSMSIRMNGEELNVPPVEKGTNTILFTESHAREGQNSLKFSGTGGWEVGEVGVFLER